jgi:hypothetical protein
MRAADEPPAQEAEQPEVRGVGYVDIGSSYIPYAGPRGCAGQVQERLAQT